jgi:oligoendopeptidase F
MDITEVVIQAKIKEQTASMEAYAKAAQNNIDAKRSEIQSATEQLQQLVKVAQSEVDQRRGAIDQLKSLIAPQSEVTEVPPEAAEVAAVPTTEG